MEKIIDGKDLLATAYSGIIWRLPSFIDTDLKKQSPDPR
jgi:hypothetical protein